MRQSAGSRRAAEELRGKIATVLLTEISDPRLESVTVTGVEVSADRAFADVWVSAPAERYAEVTAGLESAKGRIRSLVARSLGWRVMPELRFCIDGTVDEAERIATLLGRQ